MGVQSGHGRRLAWWHAHRRGIIRGARFRQLEGFLGAGGDCAEAIVAGRRPLSVASTSLRIKRLGVRVPPSAPSVSPQK